MKHILLSMLVAVLLVPACKPEDVPPMVAESNLDEPVLENCSIVAAAADAYEAQHGSYPDSVANFQSLLPDGELLVNPYTGMATEPSDGEADAQGQTRYRRVSNGVWNVGCLVTGFGESEQIAELFEPYNFDSLVIENCHIVAAAADAYAAEHGTYPDNTSQLESLLPDGDRLVNPYTTGISEPGDGTASSKGQTGYLPIPDGLVNVGYSITGFGEFSSIYQITYDSRNP
jgi:hypothetical protein